MFTVSFLTCLLLSVPQADTFCKLQTNLHHARSLQNNLTFCRVHISDNPCVISEMTGLESMKQSAVHGEKTSISDAYLKIGFKTK